MIEDILKPEFVWWKELTEDEKKVIQDPKEYPIFSIIHGMPCDVRKKIYSSMRVKDEFYSVYSHMQSGWISFFEKCYCNDHHINMENLKKDCPELNELKNGEAKEFLKLALPEKFRLYFSAKFRDEMEYNFSDDNREAFFFQVDYHLRRNN